MPHVSSSAGSNQRPILFSGLQPTGNGLMLGNLIGAVRHWAKLQHDYQCLYCVVDLHALTVRQDPQSLKKVSLRSFASYIAAGVDPKLSVIFMQSHVPEHAELGWILTCFTNMGELGRMTQFKDKSAKGQNVGAGLYIYPSLMAADILLYQTALVPVGQDQKQHLELARDIAERLIGLFGPIVKVPEIYMPKVGAKIMSLQDPSIKMSKSDPDPHATIYLIDSDADIEKKIKRAVTDSLGTIRYTEEQPGVKNLLDIQGSLLDKNPQDLAIEMEGKQYGFLKSRTAEVVLDYLRPVRTEMEKLLNDETYLKKLMKENAEKASARARPTLDAIHSAIGLVPRPR